MLRAVQQRPADVYLPDGSGPFPVLLSRTPYDKTRGRDRAERLMRHGYGVVIVDSRGIYQSEGEWRPYVTEADDGYDTQGVDRTSIVV